MIMAVPKGNPLAKSVGRLGLSLRAFADQIFIVYGRRLGPGFTTPRSQPVTKRGSVLGWVRRRRASFQL